MIKRKILNVKKSSLEDWCEDRVESYEVISDLGSGLSFKKHVLKRLIKKTLLGEVDKSS